jgi:Flp pilus assembly CpaE family ATPase
VPFGPAHRRLVGSCDILAFDALGGPLVAVCGLVGGAGASTLAYLVARRAARHSSARVLLAELHEHGALAALTGGGGRHGLAGLAAALEHGHPIGRPFTELAGGLRLLASGIPRGAAQQETTGLERVIGDARAAHGLVVIDAGLFSSLRNAELLRAATHVFWVLPATVVALRRAELLANSGALAEASPARPVIVAVSNRPGRGASVKQLRRLAQRHVERLLLVPYIAGLAEGQPAQAEAELEDTFSALATLLRRPE